LVGDGAVDLDCEFGVDHGNISMMLRWLFSIMPVFGRDFGMVGLFEGLTGETAVGVMFVTLAREHADA
jgi:hypothetical protein